MSHKIYRLVLGGMRDRLFELSEEERNDLRAKIAQAREDAGGRLVIGCYSRWASEDMPGFLLEEFPDIEAEQKYVQALEELNVFEYHNATTYLGIKWEDIWPNADD